MKSIYFLLIGLFLLISCSGLKDAGKVLRNEKVVTTDEFLVKKRNPLVLPPNFEDLPEPGSKTQIKENEEEKIKKILKAPNNNRKSNNQKSSSVEETIIEKIRK